MKSCPGCGSRLGPDDGVPAQLCLYCVNDGRDGPQLAHPIGRFGLADSVELGFDDDLTAVAAEPPPAEFPWSVSVFPPRGPLTVVDGQLSLPVAADDPG